MDKIVLAFFKISCLLSTLFLIGLAFVIQPVKASGTIYIKSDGRIDPPTAPVSNIDNVTYTFTDNIHDEIVVEMSNIIVDGNNYTLHGTDSHDSKGICLFGMRNVTIKNVRIEGFWYGIFLEDSSNSKLHRNCITANKVYGIRLWHSIGNTISGNNMIKNENGIYLRHSSNNRIYENNITANAVNGIQGLCSSNNSISGNNITNNEHGILLHESSNDNTIFENILTANKFEGISIDGSNCIIINNIVNDLYDAHEYCGIFVGMSGEGNMIVNNTVQNGFNGIQVGSNDTLVSLNTLVGNYNGISSDSTDNCIFSRNTIIKNNLAIQFRYCSDCNIFENNLNQNSIAIRLSDSCKCTFTQNNISSTAYYAIGLRGYTHNNRFYHNNFIDNRQIVYKPATDSWHPNVWDDGYPSGGNYWSDYVGVDLCRGRYQNEPDSDGIGDTPCNIDANYTDKYPLMGISHTVNTSLDYPVNVISNSTIDYFEYLESSSTIRMYVSNITAGQTYGFCRLTIPHDLLPPPYNITVNHYPVTYNTVFENETFSIVYFGYEHSTLEIVIVPEFPALIILSLYMIATLLATILHKRRIHIF